MVLAGGSGSRIGETENKVYAKVNGRPLLWYPLQAAAHFEEPVKVVVVTRPQDHHLASPVAAEFSNQPLLIPGGPTRYDSERKGIEAVMEEVGNIGLIGIHDGARPFLTVDLWQSCTEAANARGGALPTLDAGPLFRLKGDRLSPLRNGLCRTQTPQVFRGRELLQAFRRSGEAAFDTAETVMRHGNLAIAAVPGDDRNIKVTYPADLDRAAGLAHSWRRGRWLL
ncbi:MAG TPA: 2-C-methyl-D-erythritol 4-phosphate cytidylyltransferase [Acidimicrobiia bacterium]|nr:2-C-methyl-D-erythritol 4-phosphate cytidylyltransferase [Acidimicrobiia bacterium]